MLLFLSTPFTSFLFFFPFQPFFHLKVKFLIDFFIFVLQWFFYYFNQFSQQIHDLSLILHNNCILKILHYKSQPQHSFVVVIISTLFLLVDGLSVLSKRWIFQNTITIYLQKSLCFITNNCENLHI